MRIYGLDATYRDGALDVSLSEGLDEYRVLRSDGEEIARLYGNLLHKYSGERVEVTGGDVRISGDLATIEEFEADVLPHMNGNFALWTKGPFPQRIYMNEAGSIPILYCPQSRRVSSSPALMFDEAEYAERFDKERHERLIANEPMGAWIPAGLTAHSGLHRLMPHFYLDLEEFTAHRFWPRKGDLALDLDVEDAARMSAEALGRFIGASVEQFGRLSQSVTAGYDSRILLACSRPNRDSIDYFTIDPGSAHIDHGVPAALADTLGLSHRFYEPQYSTAEEGEQWDRAVGHCVRERNRETRSTLNQVPNDFIITGVCGEIGRIKLYKHDADTVNDSPATVDDTIARLGLKRDPEIRAAMERWLADIAWLPRSCVLDLAYNEVRFGIWAMAQAPAQQAVRRSLMPYTQRAVQRAFMCTPPAKRGTDRLFRRIGEVAWPDAMKLKINRFGDYRDHLIKVRKLFSREHLTRLVRHKRSA